MINTVFCGSHGWEAPAQELESLRDIAVEIMPEPKEKETVHEDSKLTQDFHDGVEVAKIIHSKHGST